VVFRARVVGAVTPCVLLPLLQPQESCPRAGGGARWRLCIRPEELQLILQVAHPRLQAVSLLQDVLKLHQGEPGPVWVVHLVHHLPLQVRLRNGALREVLILLGGKSEPAGQQAGLPLLVLQGHLQLRPLVHQAVELRLALPQLPPQLLVGGTEGLSLPPGLLQVGLHPTQPRVQLPDLLPLLLRDRL